jgi:hypothetical protein
LDRLDERRRVEFVKEGAGVERGDLLMGAPEEEDSGVDLEMEEEASRRFGRGIPLHTLAGDRGSVEGIPYPDRMRSRREYFRDVLHAKQEEMDLLEGYMPVFDKEPERVLHLPAVGDKGNGESHDAALLCAGEGIIESCVEGDLQFAGKAWVVDEGNGKTRWLWDGGELNDCTPSEHFKCETPEFVRDWVIENAFSFHFDNKKAFFHGRLRPEARKYFGVITRDKNGKLWYWRFCGWPMGWKLSPVLYHRLMAPVVRHLRSTHAILLTLFCDDGMGVNPSREGCMRDALITRRVLDLAGVTWSVAKTRWDPVQVQEHIGFVWDWERNVVYLTLVRLRKILEGIKSLMVEGVEVSHLHMAKVGGRIISAKLVGGQVVRLLTRALFEEVTPGPGRKWTDKRVVTSRIARDMGLLWEHFSGVLEVPLVRKLLPLPSTLYLGDASETGMGMRLYKLEDKIVNLLSAAPFPDDMTGKEASTYREMVVAIRGLMEVYGDKLKGTTFGYLSDNEGLTRCFQVGSRVEAQQELAVRFLLYCRNELGGACPHFFWMPREDLWIEDWLSKHGHRDLNDFQITGGACRRVVKSLVGGNVLEGGGGWWMHLVPPGMRCGRSCLRFGGDIIIKNPRWWMPFSRGGTSGSGCGCFPPFPL